MKKTCYLLLALSALALAPWISQAAAQSGYQSIENSSGAKPLQSAVQSVALPTGEYRRLAPTSSLVEILYDYGNDCIDSERYYEAIEYFNQVIELVPAFADAYFSRGNAHTYLGEHQEAKNDYSRAIDLDPDFMSAYHNRGLTYLVLQQPEKACWDFKKACMLGNCSALTWVEEDGICD